MATSVFSVRLAHAKLVTKKDFDNRVSSLDSKILVNKPKNDSIENELKKRKTFNSGYFIGKSHFEEDGTQNYLVFQPINSDYISYWKCKGLSSETITPPITSNNSVTPRLSYSGTKTRVKPTESCLKQPKPSFIYKNVANIYNVNELGASSSHSEKMRYIKKLFVRCSYINQKRRYR